MTNEEKVIIRAVIKAIAVPRNRFGRLEGDSRTSTDLRRIVAGLIGQMPHGGVDTVEQAQMVLQILVGDPPTSQWGL